MSIFETNLSNVYYAVDCFSLDRYTTFRLTKKSPKKENSKGQWLYCTYRVHSSDKAIHKSMYSKATHVLTSNSELRCSSFVFRSACVYWSIDMCVVWQMTISFSFILFFFLSFIWPKKNDGTLSLLKTISHTHARTYLQT